MNYEVVKQEREREIHGTLIKEANVKKEKEVELRGRNADGFAPNMHCVCMNMK